MMIEIVDKSPAIKWWIFPSFFVTVYQRVYQILVDKDFEPCPIFFGPIFSYDSHMILIFIPWYPHDIPMISPWYPHDIPMVANKKIRSKDSHRWDVRAQGDSRTGSQQGWFFRRPTDFIHGDQLNHGRWQFPMELSHKKIVDPNNLYNLPITISPYQNYLSIYPMNKWIYHIPNYATNLVFFMDVIWPRKTFHGRCHLW